MPVSTTGIRHQPNTWRTPFSIALIDTINTLVPGCGVGAGDLNNDGLEDLIFSDFGGTSVYLNEGGFIFKDVTSQLGVPVEELDMCTGVNIVDINGDGNRDVILSRWRKPIMVFINQGNAQFVESAKKLGLAVIDEVVHTATIDYNKDGLLDLYVVVYSNISERKRNKNGALLTASEQRHTGATDALYAQQPDGTFKNVSKEAGISDVGMGLSATVGDINNDGWPDLYVANDFNATDIVYINNKNGTFTNQQKKWLSRASQSSMGSDIADINADGLVDVLSLDMLPHDHFRRITNGSPSGDVSIYNPSFDSNQVTRNMVQINDGNSFFDVGYLTGIAATDWSWAVLVQDFDLDGKQDVFVTNGYFADITNQDYTYNLSNQKANPWKGPHLQLQDVIFRQTSPLCFERCSNDWGIKDTTSSYGATYADLDNDGDLDLVVNNLDQGPFIFKNNAIEQGRGKSLRITFQGLAKNRFGIGAKVWVYSGSTFVYKEQYTVRGYESTVSDVLTIGLGNTQKVDSVLVQWPSGAVQKIFTIQSPLIIVSEKNARQQKETPEKNSTSKNRTHTFRNVSDVCGITVQYKEDTFDDFKRYRLMPTRASWMGPALAAGDVNGDGLEDVVIGGAKNQPTSVYVQTDNGKFKPLSVQTIANDSSYEDQAILLADVDNDGDNDILISGGGVEYDILDAERDLRLYQNDGKGNFTRIKKGLPEISTNSTCLARADFDGDGDLDVFIGGGVETEQYPFPAKSYLLRNDGKLGFTDVTDTIAPMLRKVGILRSATFVDMNKDKRPDLILAGEWMPITVLQNTVRGFIDVTKELGLNGEVGWWYCATPTDVDGDGDIDIVAGNIGLNSRYQPVENEPIEIWAADFDENGSIDPIITYWNEGKRRYIRERFKLFSQMPTLNRKFVRFDQFAKATLDSIIDSTAQATCYYKAATQMQSGIFVNNGTNYTFKPFPMLAQVSPILGITALHVHSSPFPELICTGNMFGAEDDVVRYDAGRGLVLRSKGGGLYEPVPSSETGFYVTGDMRRNVVVNVGKDGKRYVICALHNTAPQTFVIEGVRK